MAVDVDVDDTPADRKGTMSPSPEGAGARRPGWVRWLRVPIVVYLAVLLLLMIFENYLVYPRWAAPPANWSPTQFAYEEAEFRAADGTRLHGWYFEHPDPVAVVLFCHGNGENVAHCGDEMDALRSEFNVSILCFDYRGYGKSEGSPYEAGVLADGEAAQRWLAERAGIRPSDVVLMARSLGGGIAVHLASTLGARGMILRSTFTTMPDTAARHYPWAPVRWLMKNRYDNLTKIQRYRGPLLMMHGTADEVVPYDLGRQLFDASPSPSKRFIEMPGTYHNSPETVEAVEAIHDFFDALPKQAAL
jgi:hypothetical protein